MADAWFGLSQEDVRQRMAEGRDNAFDQNTSRSVWSIIRANLFTLFNGIIGGCFLVLLLLGRWQDALFGFSAVANALIGSVQEFRAKRALDKLALLYAPSARVLRAGDEQEITPDSVVIDDLLVLRAGDQVAADAVVLDSKGLELDESMLTGESDPVEKALNAPVLSGSTVVAGEGIARVDKVGADSFAHSFAKEAKKFSLMASELRSSIDLVLKWVTWLVGPISLLVLNSQMVAAGGWADAIRTGAWGQAAVNTIAAIVAMIPLGLVLMTSIAFAVGAVKLSKSKVLIQELPAVEGLARVDLICLDKTGTLTEGDIVFDDIHFQGPTVPGVNSVLGWYGAQADANATAKCLSERFTDVPAADPVARIGFSSARKWSAVAFSDNPHGGWVLGAPEIVFQAADSDQAFSEPETLAALFEHARTFASMGRRTLVLAHSPEPFGTEEALAEILPARLLPVALLTFREQVRADAKETLAYFASQGVSVRIISGDNPHTVAAVAREVGLDVSDGFDARALPEEAEALSKVLREQVVFGRVTPRQKRDMVVALKRDGYTVAMTGDGVNDTLAIKEADLGIAMNSGSAATKAVSRLVLLDGKFSHLPGVVAEGRQVIANIERVSMLFLTKTAYATVLALLFGASLQEFPFLPRQLSAIDGLTIGIPAFFLALMTNTARYVPGFLRRSLGFAVPAGLAIAFIIFAYSMAARSLQIEQAQLRTGSTLILTIVGLWVLTVLSRPVTVWKALIIGSMMIALVLIYTVPLIGDFLQFVDPGLDAAMLVVVFSALGIASIELVRFIHRRTLGRRRPQRIQEGTPTSPKVSGTGPKP